MEWAGLTKILKMDWNGTVVGLLVRIDFFAQLFSFFWRLIFSLLVIFRGAAGGI